jgi:drug/metabolite transporter (DMT)-like permease
MMPLVALVSAALYGAGDFLGGLASRRMKTAAVVATSQASGLLVLLVVTGLLPPADPTPGDVGWGMAAGVSGSLGVALLYRALAIGTMGVVAPITAVCAVIIPVLASVARGVRPAAVVLAGIGLALAAIVLVSQQPGATAGHPSRGRASGLPPGIVHALCSGVAIGVFFLVLAEARPESGMWPLVGARAIAVPACAVVAFFEGVSLRQLRPRPLTTAAAAGVVDMTANGLYLVASRMGDLPVAVTLASLYPASTVILARVVLGERLHRLQLIGMICAMVAVALIVVGGSR